MMSIFWKCFSLGTLTIVVGISNAPGQAMPESPRLKTDLTLEDNFQSGKLEGSLTAGPLFSPIGASQHRPTINYAVGGLQLGYMVTSPHGDGFFRGNFEIAPEAFGGGVFEGQGSYVTGATLWFRYNFLQPNWPVVPYFQVGGGFVLTDIDRQVVGQDFNFNVDAGAGIRWFLSKRWTVNLEYRFQHISNANLGPRNVGINASGPIAGISWFF